MKISIQVRVISQTKKNARMPHFQVQGGAQSGSNGSTFLSECSASKRIKKAKVPNPQTHQMVI